MPSLTDQLSATLAAQTTAPATQPEDATCECQGCLEDEHGGVNEESVCGNSADFLVEFTGFSCGYCLPMMLSMAIAQVEDTIEPSPNEPPSVRVAEYHAGAPLFPANP